MGDRPIRPAVKAGYGYRPADRQKMRIMSQTSGINPAITNLYEAHQQLQIHLSPDQNFFGEWLPPFPALSESEMQSLDRLKTRYRYYEAQGAITEGTISLIMLAPLLELLGLCDPPYKIRSGKYIRIAIESGSTILQGLIDILVVQENLWVVGIENKRYGFSVMQALPQTLACMVGQLSERPVFGLITTGEDFLFVKFDPVLRQYDLSDKFTLSTRRENQLYGVVQIMKHLLGIASA